MRKTILWILGMAAVIILLAKASEIAELAQTVAQGAIFPLIIAAVFQFGRYLFQSIALSASFEAVGETAQWKKLMPIVFSGIFINTIAPTGGTAGTVLIVDDAYKRGIPTGKGTSAALVYQMGVYSGFILIMFIGFIILQVTGHLDLIAFLAGMVMVMVVAFFGGILFICRKNPSLLLSLFYPIERYIEKLFKKFKRNPPKPWAENLVCTARDAAEEIAKNPRGLINVLGFSLLASGLEMLCFICVGISFGVTAINELIAGYVITNIFTVVSPSPNGVGFAEAAATITLTSYGTPATISTAVALVFRGFVFWIPFAVGALLLRRTGFFTSKNDETAESKAKQTARVTGLFVFIIGVTNVFFAILPSVQSTYGLLNSWISVTSLFSGIYTVLLGIMLILMTRGIMRRSRTSWAWTLVLIVYLAAAQLINGNTWYAALPLLALAIWMFIKRKCFNKLLVHEDMRSTLMPIIYAVVIIVCYGVVGFFLLRTHFDQQLGFFSPFWEFAQTFIPLLGSPASLDGHGAWFVKSLHMVSIVVLFWAMTAVLFPWIRKVRREARSESSPVPEVLDVPLFEQGLMRHHDSSKSHKHEEKDDIEEDETVTKSKDVPSSQ
jgi:phosphatidylglycerol lysyltransferase